MASSDEEDYVFVALLLLSKAKKKKRFGVHPINRQRENRGVMARLYPQLVDDEEKFFNYARMSRTSFEELIGILHDSLRLQETNFRKPIPPRERLLLTLR